LLLLINTEETLAIGGQPLSPLKLPTNLRAY
jgi:hypothetical protein